MTRASRRRTSRGTCDENESVHSGRSANRGADADGPRAEPKFPLGKDTTYVTGPLDKDGYIDYEAALNDLLGKDITPEKNATEGDAARGEQLAYHPPMHVSQPKLAALILERQPFVVEARAGAGRWRSGRGRGRGSRRR